METNLMDTIKKIGEINKAIYGVNPFEHYSEEERRKIHQDEIDLERATDLEDLKKDNQNER